jgi:hypothetical protein
MAHVRSLAGLSFSIGLVLLVAGCTTMTPTPTSSESAVATQTDSAWEELSAKYPDLTRPDVGVIELMSFDDWAPRIAQCLQAQGFLTVTATPAHGVEWRDIPPAQAEPFALAKYVCESQYPHDPKYDLPLTDPQLGKLYDYYVEVEAPCLQAMGVDTGEPPSRETFIANYYGSGSWAPFDAVPSSGIVSISDAEAACPQESETVYEN